jgi:hypothetical protein
MIYFDISLYEEWNFQIVVACDNYDGFLTP